MTRNSRIFCRVCTLVVVIVLSGCAAPPLKPSRSEYLYVDIRKFVSGVFVDELANKYVKIDCSFSGTMAGTLPGGYSPVRYMNFDAEGLTVVVPKDMADFVFGLRRDEKIKVYGRAVRVFVRELGGKLYKDLILEADFIEKQAAK